MKRILSVFLCGSILFSGSLFGVNAYGDTVKNSSDLLDAMIYEDFEGPFVDPKVALRENFGDELAEKIINAEPDSLIMFDLVNGGVEVVDCLPKYPAIESTPAFIPEGLDIAEPFIAGNRANSMTQVEYPSMNNFPYSTNAFLEVTFKDGSTGSASGVFIDENIILTAGHVLYSVGGQYAQKIDVTPGGSLSKFKTVSVTGMSISPNWTSSFAKDYDYGVICVDVPQDTGYLGMSVKTDTQLKNMSLVGTYGYPGTNDAGRGTLWYSSGKVKQIESLVFSYTAAIGNGFSGAPVVDMADYKNTIGIRVASNGTDPIAIRVNRSIINFVQSFKSQIN